MEGTDKKKKSITSYMNILLHSVIKVRLCYCFENVTPSGENVYIVHLILNNFFVICGLIFSSKKKKISIVNRIFCEKKRFFFFRPYRPALN